MSLTFLCRIQPCQIIFTMKAMLWRCSKWESTADGRVGSERNGDPLDINQITDTEISFTYAFNGWALIRRVRRAAQLRRRVHNYGNSQSSGVTWTVEIPRKGRKYISPRPGPEANVAAVSVSESVKLCMFQAKFCGQVKRTARSCRR